jgi:uncharacterized protein YjbI with pentapeptide repeats
MVLPYGLRIEDDTAFIRQITNINFNTSDIGLELGGSSKDWSAQFAVTNGHGGTLDSDDFSSVSLQGQSLSDLNLSLAELLGVQITVASLKEEKTPTSPSTVTVLTGQELKNMGVTTTTININLEHTCKR